MKGFISIIGLLLPCTTTSHKTSVEPSLAGITPQTLATLISRPIPLPDQDTLDFLHSVLHGADVALDRRVLVHQDIEPFAHDSDTPGLRSAVQNKASAHQLALPAIIRCPIALIARISNMVKCHSRLHTTAHGAVDEDWRLEKAGARPVLDRRRLEKTPNAPFAHDSDTPGLRSAVQNKASAHQLALPAIISCPIALIARISNMVKCHSRLHTTAHGAVDEDWRLEKVGARPVLDRRRPEFAPRDYLQYPRARNSYDTKVVANAY